MNTKTCIDFANSNVLGFCQAILQPEYDLLAVVKVSTTTPACEQFEQDHCGDDEGGAV